jgi:hypothetical protein
MCSLKSCDMNDTDIEYLAHALKENTVSLMLQSCNRSGPAGPYRSIKLNRPVFTGLERFLHRPDRTGLVFFRPVTTL